jgi:hypothetical protein
MIKLMKKLVPNIISSVPINDEDFIEIEGKFIYSDYPFASGFLVPEIMFQNLINLDVNKFLSTISDITYVARRRIQYDNKPSIRFTIPNSVYLQVNYLTNCFTEKARLKSRTINEENPILFYLRNRSQLLSETSKELKIQPLMSPKETLSERIWQSHTFPNLFDLSFAKFVYQFFKSRIVLDPSAGWGDRLLGAAASGVEIYHGIDPNSNLKLPFDSMISFLIRETDIKENQYKLLIEDFLNVRIKENYYDTILTSPPYFNFEFYSDDPEQVHNQFTDFDDWIANFVIPYIDKCKKSLKKGGICCFYIINTKQKFPYIDSVVTHSSKIMKYRGMILHNRSPLWVFEKI